MKLYLSLLVAGVCLLSSFVERPEEMISAKEGLQGAWKTTSSDGVLGLWIFTENHFSISHYKSDEFLYTEGGKWSLGKSGQLQLTWEYATQSPDKVGSTTNSKLRQSVNKLTLEGIEWSRVDDGTPGK